MTMFGHLLLTLAVWAQQVWCNTEKAIFSAPDAITLPADASIGNLYLTSLNPQHLTARTYLDAAFPTSDAPKGLQSWLALEGLSPGQRYEVRVCWLATQPTSFWLYTHEFSVTTGDPDLLSSLSAYAYSRRGALSDIDVQQLQNRRADVSAGNAEASLLLLQIFAAADYFSLNQTLMQNVPPVLVDIILDPYIFNVFPQSLVPTASYIAIIAVVAWFLSAWISARLHSLARAEKTPSAEEGKKKS